LGGGWMLIGYFEVFHWVSDETRSSAIAEGPRDALVGTDI